MTLCPSCRLCVGWGADEKMLALVWLRSVLSHAPGLGTPRVDESHESVAPAAVSHVRVARGEVRHYVCRLAPDRHVHTGREEGAPPLTKNCALLSRARARGRFFFWTLHSRRTDTNQTAIVLRAISTTTWPGSRVSVQMLQWSAPCSLGTRPWEAAQERACLPSWGRSEFLLR